MPGLACRTAKAHVFPLARPAHTSATVDVGVGGGELMPSVALRFSRVDCGRVSLASKRVTSTCSKSKMQYSYATRVLTDMVEFETIWHRAIHFDPCKDVRVDGGGVLAMGSCPQFSVREPCSTHTARPHMTPGTHARHLRSLRVNLADEALMQCSFDGCHSPSVATAHRASQGRVD
jgi:hypothetical protein